MNTHTAFFGDRERAFAIMPALIPELEAKTGAGVGSLCRRLFAGDFSHGDLTEPIRLALIGGGAAPKEAAPLVAPYVTGRPLAEVYPLAVAILETLWFGAASTGEAA